MYTPSLRSARLLLALAVLPLAACDAGSDRTADPSAPHFLVVKVSGAPDFAARSVNATIQDGLDINGPDADGRSVVLTTKASAPGTYALGTEGTDIRFYQGKALISATSGTLTITDYVAGQAAKGTFTFAGAYNGMKVAFTNGSFDVKQGANVE